MDTMSKEPLCPVCGYLLHAPAWVGDLPSDDICPSCGIQFGYADAAPGSPARRQEIYRAWRRNWIEGGTKWHSTAQDPPAGWDQVKQLQRIQDRS
jgi:rRNA maturation protein Nop10